MGDRINIGAGLAVGRDQPTATDLERLRGEGYQSVVDLRVANEGEQALPPEEERQTAERTGLRYRHLPVPTDQLDGDMLERFHRAVSNLPAPVFVHCASGKRSGTFAIAHRAVLESASGDDALSWMEQHGVAYGSNELREAVRRFVDHHSADDAARPPPRAPDWLPGTSERVEAHSPDWVNRKIERAIKNSIAYHARHPERIERRLRELDREWDMERTLEANAATLALTGVALGAFVDRRFLILPAAVTVFLLQHALQGWCPPVPFFRKRGVRTAAEIARERYALKAIRGDFEGIGRGEQTHIGIRAEATGRAAHA